MGLAINGITALNNALVIKGNSAKASKPKNSNSLGLSNPFTAPNFNPTNPTSWSGAISNLMSGALSSLFSLNAQSIDGILGDPNYNPYENRHKQFIARALLGRMYTLLPWVNSLAEENKKANKMENLALAA